jgi:hypothetical protein
MIEQRQRDVDEQQARDCFVDAAVLPQRARQRDPQAARNHAGAGHGDLHRERGRAGQRQRGAGRSQRPHQQRTLPADNHHAELRRQRRTQRGQNQRSGAGERVLPGEPRPKRALIHVEIEVERVLAEQRDKHPEQRKRCDERQRWDYNHFGGAADLFAQRRPRRFF